MAVDGGGLKQVADAKGIEFKGVGVHSTDGVALVHRQRHGLAGFAQHGGNVLIGGGDTAADVGNHNDGVCQLDADFRLTAHEFQHIAVGVRLDAAGVHQRKAPAAPFAAAVNAIPGDAGGVLHNGGALAGELIKQHGFSHIGPSDDGYQWFCHDNTSFLTGVNLLWHSLAVKATGIFECGE